MSGDVHMLLNEADFIAVVTSPLLCSFFKKYIRIFAEFIPQVSPTAISVHRALLKRVSNECQLAYLSFGVNDSQGWLSP